MVLNRFYRQAFCVVLMCLTSLGASAAPPVLALEAADLPPGNLVKWSSGTPAGGTFASVGEAEPKVETVAGRRAVRFDGKGWMKASFASPNGIAGGRPFTVAAWAHVERLSNKSVILSWAGRPGDSAEFGFGRGRDGAFGGDRRDAAYSRWPSPGKWHHLACAFAEGELRVYVDGELDSVHALKLSPRQGEPMLLGAAWDRKKNEPINLFRGAIASVRVWDRALTHLEIRNDAGLLAPFLPVPADGATVDQPLVMLRWQRGVAAAAKHRVLLSTDRSALDDGKGAPHECAEPALSPGELSLGKTWFWRVESFDASGMALPSGPVWSFRLSDGPAGAPSPRDRVAGVKTGTRKLSWTPGKYAVSQDLFFGTDEAAVAGAQTPTAANLPATAKEIEIPLAALEPGKTYYWRVDQHNGVRPPARGAVWAFRTEDQPVANDVTFLVVSDTHYGLDPRGNELAAKLIDRLNWIPGTRLPEAAGGGVVRTPRGVVHLGDITNDGREDQWKMFLNDYGLKGEARLAWPVYEGFGNHDGGVANPVRKGIKERNEARQGLSHVSESGMHYSWDWDHVHLVHLNVSVGDTFHPYDPQHSREFLARDLAIHGGKPLVLLQHFGFDKDSLGWWKEEARQTYHEMIRDRNVLGIFHGHDHETLIYKWNSIDIFDVPHLRVSERSFEEPAAHGFMVVRLTPTEMIVAERKSDDTWGLVMRKAINTARKRN